jgi:diguanylate cyclase (GGDEF)-like protein
VLLPETDEKAARVVLSKIQESLLTEMQQSKWPVTLSMGAMTCAGVAPQTADELVKRADDLMYEVKREGKNSVKYATYAA